MSSGGSRLPMLPWTDPDLPSTRCTTPGVTGSATVSRQSADGRPSSSFSLGARLDGNRVASSNTSHSATGDDGARMHTAYRALSPTLEGSQRRARACAGASEAPGDAARRGAISHTAYAAHTTSRRDRACFRSEEQRQSNVLFTPLPAELSVDI